MELTDYYCSKYFCASNLLLEKLFNVGAKQTTAGHNTYNVVFKSFVVVFTLFNAFKLLYNKKAMNENERNSLVVNETEYV